MNQAQTTQLPYGRRSLASRIPMLFAGVLVSASLLGSVLGLFEMRSQDATLAKVRGPSSAASSALASMPIEERRQALATTDL